MALYTRSTLITKTLSDDPIAEGTVAEVTLIDETVHFKATLHTPEKNTLVAVPVRRTPTVPAEGIELVSPLYNNFYSHRLATVIIPR